MTGTLVCESIRKHPMEDPTPVWWFELMPTKDSEMKFTSNGINVVSDNPEAFITGRKYLIEITEILQEK